MPRELLSATSGTTGFATLVEIFQPLDVTLASGRKPRSANEWIDSINGSSPARNDFCFAYF
jgi:hypothetical protein